MSSKPLCSGTAQELPSLGQCVTSEADLRAVLLGQVGMATLLPVRYALLSEAVFLGCP